INATLTTACQSEVIKISSEIENGGDTPVYQWLLDGTPIPGENNDSLIVQWFDAGTYLITLEVESSETCGEKKISDPVSITINSSPSVTIEPESPICKLSEPINLVASVEG